MTFQQSMNDSLTRRLLLLTRFDWALASNLVHGNEVKFILKDLRQKGRDLQQHAMEGGEAGSLCTINMKQQIIYLRRKKLLILLKDYKQRSRKLQDMLDLHTNGPS